MERYQQDYIDGLRELLETFEAHPELIPEYVELSIYRRVESAGEMAELARAGGRWKKAGDERDFEMHRKFGPHKLVLYAPREEVCTAVQVGTQVVEEKDYANAPTRMVERPIVEWECLPVLSEASR